MNDACPFCAADFICDGAIDVLRACDGSETLEWRGCCAEANWALETFGPEDVLGCSWEDAAEHILDARPQRVEAGQELRRGRETELAETDGLLVFKLELEVVTGATQREVFDAIEAHHRHHQRPTGWHFGVTARRGGVLVGVAVCGRPVSRHLQAQGFVEVTRLCTWGDRRLRRDVASALYRAAAAEYKRRGQAKVLVTYTLASESGASLRAAGFKDEGAAGGGSWSRKGRARIDKAPLEAKTRWTLALN